MNNLFNHDLFNQDHVYAETATYNIAFNSYDLMSLCWASVWVAIQTMNAFDVTWIEVTSFVSALSDGWSVINKKYWNKSISLTLMIQWTDYNDLISRIDEIKRKTQWIEGNLDILVWSSIRRYAATVTSIVVPSFKRIDDFVQWVELELLITSPHWRSVDMSQVYVQWKTTDFSKVVQNEWTYKTFPIIQLITNAWSTLTGIWIEMKKVWELTWYTVSISEAISPSSVVIFNYIEKKVTINDVEVNFSGVMTELVEWQSVFSFDLTWTIDVNAYILHYPTFL